MQIINKGITVKDQRLEKNMQICPIAFKELLSSMWRLGDDFQKNSNDCD